MKFAAMAFPRHSRAGGNPAPRHSRAGGNPVITRTPLDSRLRGNDLSQSGKGKQRNAYFGKFAHRQPLPPLRQQESEGPRKCAVSLCVTPSRPFTSLVITYPSTHLPRF